MTDKPLNPDMSADELRLHMGELTAAEILVARAAIQWANSARQKEEPYQGVAGSQSDEVQEALDHHKKLQEVMDKNILEFQALPDELQHRLIWTLESSLAALLAQQPEVLSPRILGQFNNKKDWINSATRKLTGHLHEYGHETKPMCVDAIGRRCTCGGDFQRAEDEGTYPIVYFIDCENPNGLKKAADKL